jgi:hypothetical protein
MNEAVRDCLVSGYEGLKLPNPADRHVLAAEIKAGAQVIVTSNLKHFPAAGLRQWDAGAKSSDDFVLDQVGIDGRTVAACVQQIADSRTRPPQDIEDVLSQLERDGLVGSAAALHAGQRPPGGTRSTSTPLTITSLARCGSENQTLYHRCRVGRASLARTVKGFGVQYAAVTALVAQRIEHLTTDQKAGGSSPSERATSD